MALAPSPEYHDASRLIAEAFAAAFMPPEPVNVAEWAAANRWISNSGGGYVGRWRHDLAPYLREPMEVLTGDYQTIAIVGPGQCGKALALDTFLPTPSGWTTMGDVKPGDLLFDETGRPCRVVFATEVMLDHPCFQVKFSDGSTLVADAGHQWLVESENPHGGARVRQVLTTAQMAPIATYQHRGKSRNRFAIPVAAPLDLAPADLPIDPYVLGFWLGDGHLYSSQITLHEKDAQILREIEAAGFRLDHRHRTDTGVLTVAIRTPAENPGICARGHAHALTGITRTGGCAECSRQDAMHHRYGHAAGGHPRDEPRPRDTFSRRLKGLGLLNNVKAIPSVYLRASAAQRMALLQGLIDSDGSTGPRSRVEFSTTSAALRDDMIELTSSLGFKPTVGVKNPTCMSNGHRVAGATAYRISFIAYAETPVCRLERKRARLLPRQGRRPTQVGRRRIIAINPTSSVPVRCIQVNSPSRLYLAGRTMIPTHNTEIVLNWLGAAVHTDPADMLWYLPTEDMMRAFVKTRVDPLIEEHEVIGSRRGLRSTDDSLGFKRFRGMTVEFLAAVRSAMINKRAGRIVADEWDAYDPSLGDPKALLDVRRQTFGDASKLVAISHCDRARGMAPAQWTSGIMALYAESDRRIGWWECPECGCWSSPNPTASRVMALHYPADAAPDEAAEQATLICPVNGCVLTEDDRKQMIRTLRWVGIGQTIAEDGTIEGVLTRRRTAGFWIVGLMSPFLLDGMAGLVRARVKAEREMETEGSDKSLREVIVKSWGIPYEPPRRVDAIDAATIADRAEDYRLGTVPEGVRFLTAFVDVQSNRFEVLVRGWGVDAESWVVDFQRREAAPATNAAHWDALLTDLLQRRYALVNAPSRGMAIRAIGFDSGGEAGVTQQAYAAWRRLFAGQGAVKARMLGRFDGREAWNVMPTKGAGGLNAPRLQVSRPDTQRKDRRVRASGTVPIAQFGANGFKDDLAGHLAVAVPGAMYAHFPAELRGHGESLDAPHAWFEQLVAERRKPNGAWEQTSARNEATDLMVGCHVMAHLHGLAQINWMRAPTWAAEWERNTMIADITSPAASSSRAAVQPAVVAPTSLPATPRPANGRPLTIGEMLP